MQDRKKANKVSKHLKRLEEAVKKVLESGKIQEFLAFQARFRRYSLHNTLLIWSQKPDATYVAGIKTWNSLGRKVKKGEKGIAILAPILVKERQEERTDSEDKNTDLWIDETEEQEEKQKEKQEETYRLVGFKTVYVFDISQTEGKPVPEIDEGDFISHVDARSLYTHLILRIPEVFKVSISEETLFRVKGYYVPSRREIVISKDLTPEDKILTILHETAHYVIHAKGLNFERVSSEVIAEGAACLAAMHFGLDAVTPSASYVALWGQDIKVVLKCGEVIRKVTNTIIDAIGEIKQLQKAA